MSGLNAINKNNEKCLNSLKFIITSRSDQGLVAHVKSLERKQLYRLQDVTEEEARVDVATYLNASLPHFIGRLEMDQLVAHAAGLFIYAATVVKFLAGLQPLDQKHFFNKHFTTSDPTPSQLLLQGFLPLNRPLLIPSMRHYRSSSSFAPYSGLKSWTFWTCADAAIQCFKQRMNGWLSRRQVLSGMNNSCWPYRDV